jgi:hypothetical protein
MLKDEVNPKSAQLEYAETTLPPPCTIGFADATDCFSVVINNASTLCTPWKEGNVDLNIN